MTTKYITLMEKIDRTTRTALDSGVVYLMFGLVVVAAVLSVIVRV
jgi:hypothetical protein